MENGTSAKLLAGAVAGVALGVGASMFLASKKGKEIKGDITAIMVDFYKSISREIKNVEKMGEKEYKDFMKNAAEKYVQAKKISGKTAKQVIKDAQQSWKHFAKNLS